MLFEGTRDFLHGFLSIGFVPDNNTVFNNIKNKLLPRYLPVFERELKQNKSNLYLVGDKLSLADVALLEVLLELEDWMPELGDSVSLDEYPNIKVLNRDIFLLLYLFVLFKFYFNI